MCDYSRPSSRFWQVQAFEKVELFRSDFAGAVEGAVADMRGVFLDAGKLVERDTGAGAVALGFFFADAGTVKKRRGR